MRQEERTPFDEAARLHPNSWSSLEVRVLNLSANGFKAECEARVTVGSCVTLEVPGIGACHAGVVWRRGDAFGANFVHPIDVANCAWAPVSDAATLARMLVERALARRAGQFSVELELRRKILASLPMQRVTRGADAEQ